MSYAVQYQAVAASQTAKVLGGASTAGASDFLDGLIIIPANTSPGAVAVLDGSTSISVFAGGASSVTSLVPFIIPWSAASLTGAWKVTTGADVSVVAFGRWK